MTEKGKILIIDDDDDLRFILRDVLTEEGFSVSEAANGYLGVESFKNDLPHAVLLDLNMPQMNGVDTLTALKQLEPGVPVIILTAHGSITTAVEVMKLGAYDFTTKPPDFERLLLLMKRAVEYYRLELEMRSANAQLALSLEGLLGKSDAMKKVIELIQNVAQTDLSVVIQGETGTGKTFVAEALHNLSNRAQAPLVRVDIGLIPESLIESELFGHRKGSFTNASTNKTGFFEAAHRGSIFIDEIENMSSTIQCKLLTVLERKEIYPIGSTYPTGIDIRIIAASNKDIRQSVKNNEFREDLFYRLGEFIITVPPLRERREDIPFFAQKFLTEACSELKKQIRGLSLDAENFLSDYSWPGNLRELKNVIKKAVLFTSSDVIELQVLEPLLTETVCIATPKSLTLKHEIRELEKKRILEAMLKTGGNKLKAASLVEINYKSFCEKLKEYKID